MKKLYLAIFAALLSVMVCGSCERVSLDDSPSGKSSSSSMKVNVLSASDYCETKSSSETVRTRTFGDDDFSITEYVGRISDEPENPGTKGTEITKAKINQSGKQFTMEGWGKVSAHKGAPEVVTHHIDGLTTTYSGSAWNWDGGADPKWINENHLYLWSIYPVGAISPTINYDGETPANIASFTGYTANGTDLLLAYNDEARLFEKDAKGNHSYDGNGILTDNIIGDPTVNIHFYHALAEVRFVLETTMDGADVHSITLCHVGADGNIVTAGEGIATTGDCVATGSGTGTGSVSFAWSNQGTKKPLHYEFTNTQSVAGGYASTGDGVNFMIPQTVQSNDIKIIVEFSKNGSTKYYTRVLDLPAVIWQAGYYYTYKLKIGEFHVPGEKLNLSNVSISGLKNADGFVRPEKTVGSNIPDPIPIKGVTKVGLSITGYGLGAKSGQTVYMYCNKYGGFNQVPGPGNGFSFDFAPLTMVNSNMYNFGDNTMETYKNVYTFSPTTGQNKNPASNNKRAYYVFDTAGESTFLLYFMPSAQDNSGGFNAFLEALIVVEVEEDSDVPGNFPLNPWP